MKRIDFIADELTRKHIEADYYDLKKCVEHNLPKPAMILAGNIIETIFLAFMPAIIHALGENGKRLIETDLDILLEQAELKQFISKKTEKQAAIISKYRNLLNPDIDLREEVIFNNRKAIASLELVENIIDEIKVNLCKHYGCTPDDIFNILKVNAYSHCLFKNVITKLSSDEKLKLITLIIDYQITENINYMKVNFYNYISSLKYCLDEKQILGFFDKVKQEVKAKNKRRVIDLFELFSSNLDLLSSRDREYILDYVCEILQDLSFWKSRVDSLWFKMIFSRISQYLDSPKIKQSFYELAIKIVNQYNIERSNKNHYLSIFNEMVKDLSIEEKLNVKAYLKKEINNEVVDSFCTEAETFERLVF